MLDYSLTFLSIRIVVATKINMYFKLTHAHTMTIINFLGTVLFKIIKYHKDALE